MNRSVFLLAGFSVSLLAGSPATAEDTPVPCGPQAAVYFADGAPTDRFRIENRSSDVWQIVRVDIDLGTAPAGVFFDPTGAGAGSSVFQPFVDAGGDGELSGASALTDGGTVLTLSFARFPAQGMHEFTADIDDSGPTSTRVSGGEIAGASIRVAFESPFGEATKTGTFAPSGVALAGEARGCV
ncbi:MAG: aggregation factor core protein MAFp3, isoform C [Pseudomonadota bacterium]